MFIKRSFSILVACLILLPCVLPAQAVKTDSLRLSMDEAEDIFLKKNLSLLANQFNIDINKAIVEQSRVWDNPMLNTDQNIYDGKFFKHNKDRGQVYIQVQQLIKTAGKIKKETQLANDNVMTATDQLNDLIRNLRFSVASSMINLANLQRAATILNNQLGLMNNLSSGMNEMFKIGDISEKENLRIKAMVFSLQSEINENYLRQVELQKDLAVLLQLNDDVWIDVKPLNVINNVESINLQDLKITALTNRPDYLLQEHQKLYQQHYISFQKALAVPDVTIGPEYDRRNSYMPNYFGLSISLPLPLFNKNKGNIKAAELTYKQIDLGVQQLQNQISKEVLAAYIKLLSMSTLIKKDNSLLENNYEKLMKNMTSSYKSRQINLLEFIDFFDSYKQVRLQQSQMNANLLNAAAELNYTINQNLIKF